MRRVRTRNRWVPQDLGGKLWVAFVYLSLIPLAVCVYLARRYLFESPQTMLEVSVIVVLTFVVALLGFVRARRVLIDPVARLATTAAQIAGGELNRTVDAQGPVEVGDLGSSLNLMTTRLRENMHELRTCSERVHAVNREIQQKVMTLSGLLHISELISTNGELDRTLTAIVERVAQFPDSASAFLLLREPGTGALVMRAAVNVAPELRRLQVPAGQGALSTLVARPEPCVVDGAHGAPPGRELQQQFGLANLAFLPVLCHGQIVGVLGVGNDLPGAVFGADHLDVLQAFARQVAIAVENDRLVRKAEELAVRDDLTDLYNEPYIREQLTEEIRRAVLYQRPCSFVQLQIDGYREYTQRVGPARARDILRDIAGVLQRSVQGVDKVARFGDASFAVLLPEKTKKQAWAVAEAIRRAIEAASFHGERVTVSGGVSSNPLDGMSAAELILKSAQAATAAQVAGQNRVHLSAQEDAA